jgi:23S rRNA (uracil1939-C5)-methyltransferase
MQEKQVVTIEKLVHGGQGMGALPDGRKVFVWNALPGERVAVQLTKKRKDYAEGIALDILEASPRRIEPVDDAYLSTSPWQIMDFATENQAKKDILAETFHREKIELPKFNFVAGDQQYGYRNKMEYSFWADDDGLHLALFHRASHGKRIVSGSSIARPEIDKTANDILAILNKNGIRGSQLKTVVVRVNKTGETVAAVFVKDESFPDVPGLQDVCNGLAVYYSTPKSPASVLTRELYVYGDIVLTDKILDTKIRYDVNSFFQVNIPIFEKALQKINDYTSGSTDKVDMYSGVGTIGIATEGTRALIESDVRNVAMARQNVGGQSIEVVHASSEKALEYIAAESCVIVDPPRAGLHTSLVDRFLEVKPQKIVYLSCNPSTQARDTSFLQQVYAIEAFEGYNFFPRTPHIESLVVLVKK